MFFQVLAILFGLLVHPASAATAQDVADQNDAQIAACSRIIEDKTTPAKDRLMALYNRGAAYQSKDSYSEAIADFSVLLERKAIALVYADRGFCYQRLHDYKRSIDDLTEALRLDPSLAQAHKWRGVSHVNLGENVNALADFAAAQQLDPKDNEVYCRRGRTYEIVGDFKAALADYNEYLARDPKAVPAYIHRAMAFVALAMPTAPSPTPARPWNSSRATRRSASRRRRSTRTPRPTPKRSWIGSSEPGVSAQLIARLFLR
jgi:tetratricopeptide (TPR) repeat protein